MHGGGLAELTGEVGGADIGGDEGAMLLGHHGVHRQPNPGVHCVGDGIHAVPIDPFSNDLSTDVGFVAVIGGQDFNLETATLFGEILGRHLRGDHGSLAGLISERTVHIIEDADLDRGGQFGLRDGGW